MKDRARCQLLSKLNTLKEYVDKNYEEITESKAFQAHNLLDGIWETLERRKR